MGGLAGCPTELDGPVQGHRNEPVGVRPVGEEWNYP